MISSSGWGVNNLYTTSSVTPIVNVNDSVDILIMKGDLGYSVDVVTNPNILHFDTQLEVLEYIQNYMEEIFDVE